MKIGRLHVLTDTAIQGRFDHAQLAACAVEGGADVIQLRQKSGTTRTMIETARAVRAICRRAGIPLIVNDRIDVAIAADADGVHLGDEDFPVSLARTLLGPHRIIGASAGSVEEAMAGYRSGADYLGCGPVYATASKPDAGPAAGLELIRLVRAAVPVPLIGIGGIDASNAGQVLEAGAHGIAVISAVCASSRPDEATRRLREIVEGKGPRRTSAASRP